jgi:L-arabinokinase
VVSDLPREFLRARLGETGWDLVAGSFDVSMVQLDSVRVDLDATRRAALDLCGRRDELVRDQSKFLADCRASVVVADIPSIPIEAAKRVGVPAVAVGNFGWDWIYEEFSMRDPRWQPAVDMIGEGYRKADLLLRLPFAEPMAAFTHIEDVPLLARSGRSRREELARITGADAGALWSLLSFTTLDWTEAALDRIAALAGVEFFTVKPLAWRRHNIHAVDRLEFPYADVIASVDVVVTKPGFGVLSECIVNNKPIVYTERTDFREYEVLVASTKKFLRNVHIPSAALYRGELGEALEAVRSAPPPPEKLGAGGDRIAAERILSFVTQS